ncbi:vitamin K epoxide reductase family protein [uncultured Psychroserpens sp.]|uniref:vitamin K epoxide reductase family protein n=1 Tax=uncultured Psychroserpens sp. TaxID=255436 RepID=UPI00262F7431|nr:vitamin K epoxide reductase family protein [uncultured Psychroserpens sp.]
MQNHLYEILKKLLVNNNIKINNEELKLQLSSHPSYPSLHALTGVLDHFNIPNLALQLAVNNDIFEQLPISFIANVSIDKGDHLALIEKKKNRIKILTDTNKNRFVTKEEFLEQWNGIIVAIEKDETVKEAINNPITKVTKQILIVLGILFTGYLMYSYNILFAQVHFLLSGLGLMVSVFVLRHELGTQSSTANSFCNLSQKTSCDAVLNSKGATILGAIKLNDISIVVFSCYSLCWFLLFVSKNPNFSIMSIVTLLAFPFVLYSIYYQYNVVKKWCPLCLVIASVFMFQIGALFFTKAYVELIAFDVQSTVLFFIALITVIGFWSFFKPLLKKKTSLEKTEIEHHKFKRNFSLFNVLLNEGDTLGNFTPIEGELSFGNPKASIHLVLVTSPLCYYCKKAHNDIEQLIHKVGNKINLTIRFNSDVTNQNSQLYKIASRLLEVYNSKGETETLKVLADVYSDDVNLENWLWNQPQNVSTGYDSILEKQSNWCEANAVNFTPALYINNKLFPYEYDRLDLVYFIDDLIQFQNASSILSNTKAIAS